MIVKFALQFPAAPSHPRLRLVSIISARRLGLALALLSTSLFYDAGAASMQAVASAPSDADVIAFVQSAAEGDQDAIQSALEEGMDINARTPAGLTAYHVAASRGYVDLAKFLVEQGADTSIPRPAPNALATAMLGHKIDDKSPALVVLVSRDGEIVFEHAFGNADIEGSVGASIDTKFRIGSVTKQFTAAAILKLQEKGKLSVDDTLSEYYPEFPNGDRIMLHHLLTHTSGMLSYTSRPEFQTRVTSEIAADDLIEEIQQYKVGFDPGEKWEYCNSGYMILGRIVERVSGEPYGDYLQTQFFGPLGMKDTGVYSHATYENDSLGYSYVEEGFQRAKPWHMSWAGGAGALYSTVHDLMRWNEAVFNGEVLSGSSLEAAHSRAKLNDGSTTGYGYGWGIGDARGVSDLRQSRRLPM